MPKFDAVELARMNERNAKAGAKFKGFAPGEPKGIAINKDEANYEDVWPLSSIVNDACRRLGLPSQVLDFLGRELIFFPEEGWRSGDLDVMATAGDYNISVATLEGYLSYLVLSGIVTTRQHKTQIREDREIGSAWFSLAPLGARIEYFALLSANFHADCDANDATRKRMHEENRQRRKIVGNVRNRKPKDGE